VRSRSDDFGDAAIVVITFSAPEQALRHRQERLTPLQILVDEERNSYRAYGLGRGRVWNVWGPKVWLAYARLLLSGERFRRPVDDTMQLGGDVVVGSDGTISFLFRSEGPADRPTVDELVAAVHER